MFRDIGYTQFGAQSNGAVPEPSTILLLLGSLGVRRGAPSQGALIRTARSSGSAVAPEWRQAGLGRP